MPATGNSHRIGISGPPGVGKSTLIDALGMLLVDAGHQVAVLTVDPSSSLSGGSILGDKSRMARLAQADDAFIRPSPSSQTLGGVARRTREAMLLCEAAGFDRVLVETVGVGQSEIQVAGMVDSFLVLVQPGAGDELQGIKKGIIELADLLAVNKADGDNLTLAREAEVEYRAALRYSSARSGSWTPQVISVSALTGDGLPRLLSLLAEHHEAVTAAGALEARRAIDVERWLTELSQEAMLRTFEQHDESRERLSATAGEVAKGTTSAHLAARLLASLTGDS